LQNRRNENKKGSGGNTGNIAAAMQSISYQIQHTVCNSDYIISGREMKGNAGDFP